MKPAKKKSVFVKQPATPSVVWPNNPTPSTSDDGDDESESSDDD